MPSANNASKYWIIGIAIGLIVWFALSGLGSLSMVAGLLLGIISAVVIAGILIWLNEGTEAVDAKLWEPAPVTYAPSVAKAVAPIKEPAEKKTAVAKKTQAVSKPAKTVKPKAAKSTERSDNLKEIKGVGPKLEDLLHQHGVRTFSQIAVWSDAEIDRFAELIGRTGGRIRSDDWVAQAKILAAGGETEFSTRVDKGDVY